MASDEDSLQFRHISLLTRQCRLRHLHGIAVRNLTLKGDRPLPGPLTQIQVYFTLHLTLHHPAFYTSSKITGSLNPTWTSIALPAVIAEHNVDLAGKFVVVQVWRGWQDNYTPCIQWHVDLSQLTYLGEKIQREGSQFADDSLVFAMFDGYYGIQTTKMSGERDSEGATSVTVCQTLVRNSYNVDTLLRIQMITRAIKQTKTSVVKVKQHIEDRLPVSSALQKKTCERELLNSRTSLMAADLSWRMTRLHSERNKCSLLLSGNRQREVSLKKCFEILHEDKVALHENKRSYFQVREELIKTGAQLVMRRKQLISELSLIYPIVEDRHSHTVCRVGLPNSEDFAGQDELMICVALGYTSHLVTMIAHFLDVPLRYPVTCLGSRSLISDYIIEKLTEKERDFPLYSKGRERFQYNYAVYLLNKDIAQLRFYCGLGTTDLRLTLPNLKTLLELRLGVKLDVNRTLLNASQQSVPSCGSDECRRRKDGMPSAVVRPGDDTTAHSKHTDKTDGASSNSTDEARQCDCCDQRSPFKDSNDSFFETKHSPSSQSPAQCHLVDNRNCLLIRNDAEHMSSDDDNSATYDTKVKLWSSECGPSCDSGHEVVPDYAAKKKTLKTMQHI